MAIRVGFIGAGFIGERHIKNMKGFPDVQVAGVADVAFERAEAQAALVGGPSF